MSDDLISRQAALDALEWKWAGKAAIDAIKNLPPAQTETVCIAKVTLSDEQIQEAVEKVKNEVVQVLPSEQPEIIRCGKCTHKDKKIDYCHYLGITICESDFCSYAERRTDE